MKRFFAAVPLACALAGCHPTAVVPVQPAAVIQQPMVVQPMMQPAPVMAQPGYTYVWDTTLGRWDYEPMVVVQRNTVRYRTVSPAGQTWTSVNHSSPAYRPVMINRTGSGFGSTTSRPATSSSGSFGSSRAVAPAPPNGGSFGTTTRSTTSSIGTSKPGYSGSSGSFGNFSRPGSFGSSSSTPSRTSGSFGTSSSTRPSGSFGTKR